MHTLEQVKELLEIIEIEDDKIEILMKEQSLEQAHAAIDIDLLIIYYNCFQYEETWEHISQSLGGSASDWVHFIENQHEKDPVYQKGIQTLIKKVFIHINPWYKYEKSWKSLLKHCDEEAKDPNKLKDRLIEQLFEDPPKTSEAHKILIEYTEKPKYAKPHQKWRSLTDEEFRHICELEDSVATLIQVLDIWSAGDTIGKMNLYADVLEKIAQHAADLDNVRYVWNFIKTYEKNFGIRKEEVRLSIRRAAFREYKLPTIVSPMFF